MSNRMPSMPVGKPGFSTGTWYSVTFPVLRETIPTLLVGDDGDGDRSAGLPGTDEHPLHGALLREGDLPGQRRRSLSSSVEGTASWLKEHDRDASDRHE